MTTSHAIPPVQTLKTRAMRLRIRQNSMDDPITHSKALEYVAHQMGYKDWNTLHARSNILQAGCPFSIGDQVTGTYIGQPFTGKVIELSWLHQLNQTKITIHFDAPIDVVRFSSFSALRQRVRCTLNLDYTSDEVTSDGQPIMQLNSEN